MKKINLGIMVRSFDQLSNAELRIYDQLIKSKYLNIKVLIKDGRTKEKKSILRFLRINIITKLLFISINKIDQYFFNDNFLKFKNKNYIIKKLGKFNTIKLYPEKKKFVDYFNNKECLKLKKFKLDLILRNEFNIIKGDILNMPKFGIWSFHHGENDYYRGGPAGFWEVLNNEKTTGVTLQKLNNKLDGGLIIDKAHFPTQLSFIRNNAYILEKSTSILIKNIKLLYYRSKITGVKSKTSNYKIYKYPDRITTVIKYLIIILNNFIFSRIIKKIAFLLNYRLNMWSLFLIRDNIFSNKINKIIPIFPPKGFFYADPFIIKNNKKLFIFFEKFSYKKNKGHISCGEIKNNKIINVQDILISKKHFSYPFIFFYKKKYFLIPESYQSKMLKIYKSEQFPYKWKLHKNIFKNTVIGDPTILNYKKQLWLFINKSSEPYEDLSSELYIYKISCMNFKKIIPHKMNPVIIDSRKARSAGNFFVKNGKLYRPSQSNIKSIYGHSINISQVNKLNINEYDETVVKVIMPNFYKNVFATHHLSWTKDLSIIDGCFRYYK